MKKSKVVLLCAAAACALLSAFWIGLILSFPRPYRRTVESSGIDPSLVYAVIRAESAYREDAVSGAGAVGLMQLRPSTAEFICRREGIPFEREKLTEGEYNITLGTRYLIYLFGRFRAESAALAAYNAGEGTVTEWLGDDRYSKDGITLERIPYGETAAYLKKIEKFRKIYEILY